MRVFSLVMLIVGGFIGAGFASGREIATYFSKFGKASYLGVIIAMLILFLLVYFFLMLSEKFNSFGDLIKSIFGKFSRFINLLFIMCILIIVSTMIAGSGEVAQSLGFNKIIVMCITVLLTYFITIGNVKSIDMVSKILVPIMLIIIIYIGLSSKGESTIFNGKYMSSIISGISYIFINIISLGLFILSIGKKYTKKQKIMASLLVSLIIGIVLAILNYSILKNDVISSSMPVLELSKNKGFYLYLITTITIWLALLTTLISNVYILKNYLSKFISNDYFLVFLILILGALLSFFGFEFMVNYVYMFIGGVGLLLVLKLIIKEKEAIKINRFKNL